MRFRMLLTALSLILIPAPARAELGASGTRIAIGGGEPRFYMTWGHADDVELFAPVMPDLRRMQVTFEERGERFLVLYKGAQVADWPVVRNREAVPETLEEPFILMLAGNRFVPLRKLAEIVPIDVKWDKRGNLLSLVPGKPRSRPRVAQAPGEPAPVPAGMVSLTGVTLEQDGAVIRVRIPSSAPIRPTSFYLKNPARVVLDFNGARWADGLQAPPGVGDVRQVRIGHPVPDQARLVLDVESPLTRVIDLRMLSGEVQASVGAGTQVAGVPAGQAATIRAITRRRTGTIVDPGSRGGLQLGPGGIPPLEPPVNPPEPRVGPIPSPREVPPDQTTALAGRLICVDAGHGGKSAGARGVSSLEKDLCLQMCMAFRSALQARGATVLMTRESDVYVSLDERCAFANDNRADIFVSIHCNSTLPPVNRISGSETYWRNPQGFRLAQTLHPRLVGTVQGRDGGIRNRSFAVIRETTMPSVLLEIGYINHTGDEALLARPDFHAALADELAQGVVQYFAAGR